MWELLAPAGSYDSIIAAVNAGADAVYVGGSRFGARAYADNPEEGQLLRGLEYCHLHGRRLYLTVNTLLKDYELDEMLGSYLLPYYENGLDGVIVQDFGAMRYMRRHFPGLSLHASTQMTVTGTDGVRLLQREGISRVVPARELSLEEIRSMIEETGVEVETFVHGAMCYSYSGQCLFSSILGGRSGNRGRCAQPCRLPYRLEGSRETPAYLFSMKDMCALDILPELLDAGIASLKIEGRMKRPEYTAGVTSVYRKYIDRYKETGKEDYQVDEEDRIVLLDLYNRGGFSEGYYHTHNGKNMMALHRPNHKGTAAVRLSTGKNGRQRMTALEPLGKGDVLELTSGEEITLGEPVKKGDPVRLSSPRITRAKDGVFYRTKNVQLLQQLKEQFLDRELREKVTGELTVSGDGRAVLSLTCRDISIVHAQQIGQPAQNQPASEDFVRRQMAKTGNTAFVLEELKLSLADGLFLPAAGLNELRRTALEKLRTEMLVRARQRLDQSGKSGVSYNADGCPARSKPKISVRPRLNILVTTEEQLSAVLESDSSGIDTVYLDSLLYGLETEQRIRETFDKVKRRGWRCFLNFPEVLRTREREFLTSERMHRLLREADGFLLHTVDELSFCQEYACADGRSAVLASDENLYAYNQSAVRFLQSHGVTRLTLPAELNFRELLRLTQNQQEPDPVQADHGQENAESGVSHTDPQVERELVVYGYQPLMRSAQCVRKNTSGCTKTSGITYLRDRKNVRFPVMNRCLFCCNTIYNSVPLMLCDCRKELDRLAPSYVRLSFTVESAEETARVLGLCKKILFDDRQTVCGKNVEDAMDSGSGGASGKTDHVGNRANMWTRGHFKRGVE